MSQPPEAQPADALIRILGAGAFDCLAGAEAAV